jgi:tetratricopeptide (TPR) repeat protein
MQPLAKPARKARSPEIKRGRKKIWGFRLLAIFAVPAVLFGVVEIGLRLAGYGYDPSFLVRDEQDATKLRDNFQFGWRFFPKALSRTPQPFRVTETKPEGTMRILVVGGSAAMGDPEPAYGPSRTLEVLLQARYPKRKFEIVNMAVTAINSHVVLPIVRDCMRLKPDVVIVYMGNNEVHGPFGSGTVFSEQAPPLWAIRFGLAAKTTKLGQLASRFGGTEGIPESWGGMEMFLKQRVAWQDEKLKSVYRHYEANLHDIIDVALEGRAKVIVSTVAVNLKDSPPFISLPEDTTEEWKRFMAEAEAARKSGNQEAAMSAFNSARKLTPGHAELHYRFGHFFLEADLLPEAKEAFERSCDYDALRFRADSQINRIIAQVANDRAGDGVIFVDAEQEFAEVSPDGITGENLLWEHVHLNFSGSYLLGRLLAEKVAESLALPSGDASTGDWLAQDDCLKRLGLTLFHQREIVLSVKQRLSVPPFSRQFGHVERMERFDRIAEEMQREMFTLSAPEAVKNFENLIAAHPDDWMLRKEFASFLTVGGQIDAAIEQRKKITRLLPHNPDAFHLLGSLFNHAHKWQEAEEPLRRAIQLRPDFAPARNSLGITLSRTGSADDACTQFAKAIEIMPDYAEAHVNWALVLQNAGRIDEAVMRLQTLLEVDPDQPGAHYQLGSHFTKIKDLEKAAHHYREVARLVPGDPGSWLNLGLLYFRQNKYPQAIEQFQRALDIDPNNQLAREQLEKLRRQ